MTATPVGQIKVGPILFTILRHCHLNGNQIKMEILNSLRGKCCLSVLSHTQKLQHDPKTDWHHCLLSFVVLQKAVDYLGRASKAIKEIPYVKLQFRQDKLDVWGNVLIKYSRNNESVYDL